MGAIDKCAPAFGPDDLKLLAGYIKKHGVLQFLNLYRSNMGRHEDDLYWGDEIEFSLVRFESDKAQLALVSPELLELLAEDTKNSRSNAVEWQPEACRYMLETTPAKPFSQTEPYILTKVKHHMRLRREEMQIALQRLPQKLASQELLDTLAQNQVFVVSLTAFPRFGLPQFTSPPLTQDDQRSIFINESQLLHPHPRYVALNASTRAQLSGRPFIAIPRSASPLTSTTAALPDDAAMMESEGLAERSEPALHISNANHLALPSSKPVMSGKEVIKDERDWSKAAEISAVDKLDLSRNGARTVNPVQNHIFFDHITIGSGMCCLQTTHGFADEATARWAYDQLLILAPLFHALSASTPCIRGLLSSYDGRWPVMEPAHIDRAQDLGDGSRGRYSAAPLFLGRELLKDPQREKNLNDVEISISEEAEKVLRDAQIDPLLARHVAWVFSHEPLYIPEDSLVLDDSQSQYHWELLNGTQWNSVRLKPPSGHAGWRVELRTMDLQLSDTENAALAIFPMILARALLQERRANLACGDDFDLYMPISKTKQNMRRAGVKNAAQSQKFWWRRNYVRRKSEVNDELDQLSLADIMYGSRDGCVGLLKLCENYIVKHLPEDEAQLLCCHLRLFGARTTGKILTDAQFLRRFIRRHPSYAHDGVVNDAICRDICALAVNVGFERIILLDTVGYEVAGSILETLKTKPSKTGTARRLPQVSEDGMSVFQPVIQEDGVLFLSFRDE